MKRKLTTGISFLFPPPQPSFTLDPGPECLKYWTIVSSTGQLSKELDKFALFVSVTDRIRDL
jgi:hypothetical protein